MSEPWRTMKENKMSSIHFARRFHFVILQKDFRLARQCVPLLATRPPLSAGFLHVPQLGEQRPSEHGATTAVRSARGRGVRRSRSNPASETIRQARYTHTCTARGWQSIARAAATAAAVGWLPAWRTHAGERTRPREPADFNAARYGIHMHGRRLTIVQIQFSSPGKNDLGKIIRIFIRVPYHVALGAVYK